MINHKEAEILTYLIKRSPNSTYIVIEPQEILDNISEKITKDELIQQLTDLASRDAILIRIVNLDECVLAPTPKAKVLIDELMEMEEAKDMINTVKSTVTPVVVEEDIKENKKVFKKTSPKKVAEDKPAITKVVIDYKKIFMSAFWGAVSGGGIIAIIMLIIGLCIR